MSWLGDFYIQVWYHTEFWLTPLERRPFTFIIRDWIYTHVELTMCFVVLFYIGMIILSHWLGTTSTIIASIGSAILAHLIWGTAWIEKQQEVPPYLEEE